MCYTNNVGLDEMFTLFFVKISLIYGSVLGTRKKKTSRPQCASVTIRLARQRKPFAKHGSLDLTLTYLFVVFIPLNSYISRFCRTTYFKKNKFHMETWTKIIHVLWSC